MFGRWIYDELFKEKSYSEIHLLLLARQSQLIDLFWLLGGFSRGGGEKNQDFMLIRFLNARI